MNGLYVYSIMVAGSLLALVIWISRRYDVPLYGQAVIASLFSAFMLLAVIMTGLYSPFQSSVLLAQQNRDPTLAATPSVNRVFLEKFFDTRRHSGQQPFQPALAYAASESDVLDNEGKITSGPLLGLDSWVAVYDMQNGTPTLAGAPSANRELLEKFFGTPSHSGQQPFQPMLAYAAPERDVFDNEGKITTGPLLGLDSGAAFYDISAHTVYLPDGTELEAHSGQGGRLDDPRYVHEHMRGATPPNVYELALREKTFHGVQALRLKPIGNGNVFGRSGLLAHTYMLGPKGESNGCVVFKNYKVFLQAFQNGQIKRLIVVDNLNRNSKVTLTADQNLTAQPGIRMR
ncbi:MAG TPA: DUF2778 domain-containing protein [Methylocella sp.]|nr:DUF2778 domain-containing protein [Methylocella sp.]